jgi:peptide/nickel transport system substrate-binding protein
MKKIAWMVLACLVVAAFVLAACGEKTTTPPVVTTTPPGQTTTPPVVTTTPPVVTTTPPATGEEKPQYGGIHRSVSAVDFLYFDDTVGNNVYCYSTRYTNDELLQGDWAKGPAGTGECEWKVGGTNRIDQKAGSLAESWEIPQQGTIIFHIRQGVHWALNPKSEASRLVNGREMTVQDVIYSLNRVFTTPGSYLRTGYPGLSNTAVVTAGPEDTVIVTAPLSEWVNLITLVPDFIEIVPKEVIDKYGNMQDWRNSVGTGAFMLTDFVTNSQVIYTKNPNYWMKNPVGPGKGDQLPYLDGIKTAIITDSATRVAAFRTGKVNVLGDTATNRNLIGQLLDDPALGIKADRYLYDSCYAIGLRTDMADSPFSKKDVRQAIMYAVNLKAVRDSYYMGDSELLVWPVTPLREYMDLYVPLEELPANVQALYNGPDVTKAKELLKNAGYPNGFSITAIGSAVNPVCVDILSMYQADLAKVGITMTLNLLEQATYTSRMQARTFGAYDVLWSGNAGIGTYQKMINMRGTTTYNVSYINDPVVEAAYKEMLKYIGIDEAKCMKISHDLMPYLLEQAYIIPVPAAYLYVAWWPWVKNYHGEIGVGYYNGVDVGKYIWLDEALKKQMGY